MAFSKLVKGYSPISTKYDSSANAQDESEAFLSGEKLTRESRRSIWSLGRAYWIATSINAILFISSLGLAWSGYRYKASLRQNDNNELIRLVDWYSPVHNDVNIPFVELTINGTLLNLSNDIFRQPPSPDVDAAWERIGSLLPHVISTEDVIKLGKDPTKTARWTEDWGFGPEAHVAEVDVLHTIHCLNAIRRDVHWKHYFGDVYPDGEFPPLHKVHTDHCIHVVLQNLMCGATADLVTEPWVEGQITPFPDFSVNKKCRDFGAILRWHEETAIRDTERYSKMRPPPDHVPLRMSDEFKRLFGYEDGVEGDVHHHG